jgi:glyoxylase-like metal-dependent hydrolase (beta-lactamase superfamily II)
MTAFAARIETLNVGDAEVTYLPDGVHHVQGPAHYPSCPARVFDDHPEVIDEDGWLVMSVGAFLVRGAGPTVLVDTGAGPVHASMDVLTGGRYHGDLIGGDLLKSLSEVGVSPAEVDAVAFTHMHNDHIGWVATDGAPTFPNARYLIDAREWAYWSHPDQVGSVAGASQAQLGVLATALAAYDAATGIAEGVTTFATPGHTPGHTSILVSSRGQSALILGDAFHCPVELLNPGMEFVFDQDIEQANRSRRRIEERLRQPGTWFAGGHFPNHVFGQLHQGASGPELRYPG